MSALKLDVLVFLAGAAPSKMDRFIRAGIYQIRDEGPGDTYRITYLGSDAELPDEWLTATFIRSTWPLISEKLPTPTPPQLDAEALVTFVAWFRRHNGASDSDVSLTRREERDPHEARDVSDSELRALVAEFGLRGTGDVAGKPYSPPSAAPWGPVVDDFDADLADAILFAFTEWLPHEGVPTEAEAVLKVDGWYVVEFGPAACEPDGSPRDGSLGEGRVWAVRLATGAEAMAGSSTRGWRFAACTLDRTQNL